MSETERERAQRAWDEACARASITFHPRFMGPVISDALLSFAASETAALREQLAALKEELDNVLGDWNSLVKASGSRTNGGAVGHVTQMRARLAELERALESLCRGHNGGRGCTCSACSLLAGKEKAAPSAAPERCPRCGSDDKQSPNMPCAFPPDPWHNAAEQPGHNPKEGVMPDESTIRRPDSARGPSERAEGNEKAAPTEELRRIEAEAGYIKAEEWPNEDLTFRTNVREAIEKAYALGQQASGKQ